MWRGLLTDSFEDAKIAVFGIATDGNCSVGLGAAKAPSVMRECSEYLPPVTVNGNILESMMFDLGDVEQYDYQLVYDKMQRCQKKKFTLILGGDHSVSIFGQKAYRQLKDGKRGIIHIDAHADICDFYDGSDHSHACVNRRALDNGYATDDITMIGIRSYEVQEVEFLANNSLDVYSTEDVIAQGIDNIIDKICNKYKDYDGVYLSFDIDAVDPSFAPGTGTPEHFGLSSMAVLKMLKAFVSRLSVDVMDVVEVSPPLDCNDITTWLALKCILEILYVVNEK